jgi:hypothetical protein
MRTIAAEQEAVETQLENLAAAPGIIMRLAGWDWIRQSASSLPKSHMVFR